MRLLIAERPSVAKAIASELGRTGKGDDFIQWRPPSGDISTLGLVDFSICPHLAPDGMPGNTMAEAEQWAAGISGPAYAVDDQTAFKVVDGAVEIVSEGHWKQLR